MTYARKALVSLDDTPYYHVVSRCVRRAWLWGVDDYAGRDYSHRKQWILDRLSQLTSIFAVEVCAYAVMSNHYHLVLYVDRSAARQWSREEVIERWKQLFRLPVLVDRCLSGEAGAAEREAVELIVERWRARLHDLSWFMKCLNEPLARRANAEDDCRGRFWEGRFRSQALLDEAGLLTAMVYVDLNPIRAGIAATPEESQFTSIYERIRGLRMKTSPQPIHPFTSQLRLRRFSTACDASSSALPYALEAYLELVDWSGRIVRDGKPGSIDAQAPPIMARLNVDPDAWAAAMKPGGGSLFGRAMGRLNHLRLHAKTLGQSWVRGLLAAERLYA